MGFSLPVLGNKSHRANSSTMKFKNRSSDPLFSCSNHELPRRGKDAWGNPEYFFAAVYE